MCIPACRVCLRSFSIEKLLHATCAIADWVQTEWALGFAACRWTERRLLLLIVDTEYTCNLHTIGCERTSWISCSHLLRFCLKGRRRRPILKHRLRHSVVLRIDIHHYISCVLHGIEARLRVIWLPLPLLELTGSNGPSLPARRVKWKLNNLLVSFIDISNIMFHNLACMLEMLVKIWIFFINSILVTHEALVACVHPLLQGDMRRWRWSYNATVFEWCLTHWQGYPVIVIVPWLRVCSIAASTAYTEGRIHNISLPLPFNFPENWSAALLFRVPFELGYALVQVFGIYRRDWPTGNLHSWIHIILGISK